LTSPAGRLRSAPAGSRTTGARLPDPRRRGRNILDRNAAILGGLDRASARILEIGPSYGPIAPKRAGWRTTVVDHTDRAGLVAKYTPLNVDVSAIEEVDRIWDGRPLEMVIPPEDHATYDALIASHVIEHIVDPISFLASADHLLVSGGKVLLAVPDLRLCFDCMRPPSTTGQVIAAWREKRTRHTWSAVFDNLAYAALPVDGSPGWMRAAVPPLQLSNDLIKIWPTAARYEDRGDGEYLDTHGWTFTPATFALLMLELEALQLSRWRVARIVECPGVEFLAFLERAPARPPSDAELRLRRMQLLSQRWAEMREQADWMLGKIEPLVLPALASAPASTAPADDPLGAVEEKLRQVSARLARARADMRAQAAPPRIQGS
jgi:SAM-dependent methyltransferase